MSDRYVYHFPLSLRGDFEEWFQISGKHLAYLRMDQRAEQNHVATFLGSMTGRISYHLASIDHHGTTVGFATNGSEASTIRSGDSDTS